MAIATAALLAVIVAGSAVARGSIRSPFTLKKFTLTMIDSAERRARIVLELVVHTGGNVDVTLNLSGRTLYTNDSARLVAGLPSQQEQASRNGRIERSWEVILPHDGFLQVGSVALCRIGMAAGASDEFSGGALYPLYAEMRAGRIVSAGTEPPAEWVAPPTDISMMTQKQKGRSLQSAATQVTISISGRVTAKTERGTIYGVPNTAVFFDWDLDQNPFTTDAPSYVGNVPRYAITDADGFYTFTRQADLSPGSPYWNVSKIRIYAEIANGAAYEYDWGIDAIYPEQGSESVMFSPASPIVAIAHDLRADDERGMAMRYMWRAREFARETFWLAPPMIPVEIDHSWSNSFFYAPTLFINARIVINHYPEADVSYHEYGHYLHYQWARDLMPEGNCPSVHHLEVLSNDACALNEGWATFFCAAANNFWCRREMPALRERGQWGTPRDQFLDSDYGRVPLSNGESEGAVARIFYNLWDHYTLRAPTTDPDDTAFTGDNDDLDHNRPFGHPHPWLMYVLKDCWRLTPVRLNNGTIGYRRYTPFIRFSLDAYLKYVTMWYPITDAYHRESIDAMYDYLTARADSLRAATPTTLTVTGDRVSRTLTWNDLTEPHDVVYAVEGGGAVDLITNWRNNEAGFVIWRKEWPVITKRPVFDEPGIMDGRLDAGYQIAGVVGADVTQYTDFMPLTKGYYTYVVVAFKDREHRAPTRLSIPKAIAAIAIDGPITIRRDDPPGAACPPSIVIPPGGRESLVADEGGIAGASYRWITSGKPGYISLEGELTDTVRIINSYQPGIDYQPGMIVAPFSVRCIRTTATSSDTSAPYFPMFTPLDSANAFVSVWDGSGWAPEGSTARPGDFLGMPGEDVISLHRLGRAVIGDSAMGYRVMLKRFVAGEGTFTRARLLAVDHPAGTELGGSAECGFRVLIRTGDTLTEDTSRMYGMEELPLTSAWHSRLGVVSDYVREHDSLWVELEGDDSLVLRFDPVAYDGASVAVADSQVMLDTSRAGWVREYLLELRGRYLPGAGGGGMTPGVVAGAREPEGAEGYALRQNQPNPHSGITLLEYTLGEAGPTRLLLYDARGEAVRTFVDAMQERGSYAVRVDVSELPAGIYYYRLTSGSWSQGMMMTLVR